MIQSAKDIPLHELFSPELNIKYSIPKYQREYSWRRDNWEDLWNDIYGEDESDEGPFLGSIICVNKSDATAPILEVIDGQQRLTTISLLYSAIYSKLMENPKMNDELKSELINLKYRIVQKKKPTEIKLELSYQNNNFEDYKEILEESGIIGAKEGRPKNIGNRRLYRAYSFFSVKLEGLDYGKVKRLLDKINSSHIIKIEVNTNSDAFNLFESINNRGEPLSPIDLIKNNLLSTLDKKKTMTIEDAFEEWKAILDNLTEDPKMQERFLRHFYNAFKHKEEIKVKTKEGKATKSNIIRVYDQLIERNPTFLLNALNNKSLIFRRCIAPEIDDLLYNEFSDLLNIGGTPSYIFILYLINEFSNQKELIKETLSFLSKYFVRRNLTDYPATRNLDNIFISLIDECEKNKKSISFNIIKTFLVNPERYAEEDLFREKLGSDIYEINTEVARFILCKIEEEHNPKKESFELWKRDNKDKYLFTIEHILPEGERIPKDWVEMIAKGSKEEAKILQDKYVHKLGNLTLTGYNSNLSNLSFDKKRDRKDKKGNWIGYRNKLYLNNELYPLSRLDKWTIEDIEKRTNILVNQAMKLFI